MTITKSSVKRAIDPDGDAILTYEDVDENQIQAVVLHTDLAGYGTNDVEEASATVTYVGKEKPDGTWLVMKIDTTSGTTIRYASEVNNALVTDYAAAWAARATLTYGTYSEVI